ncbi:MAG: hypothetical protein OEU36_19855, partial [Gammaproteobacteria bacterium]|nr:hypothetical protein [Gammaproteobacteria bacterium]
KRENILVIGYPYLEMKRTKYKNIAKTDQVLFISQPTIGKQLASFCLKLRNIQPRSISIAFKLHPAEMADWREQYGHLIDAGITVIDSNDPELHLLQAQSRWQIGVYSTALYEGCTFGCGTFLVQLPGVEYMTDFVASGFAKIVETAEEVQLIDCNSMANSSEIFAVDWQSNWAEAVEEIEVSYRGRCVG